MQGKNSSSDTGLNVKLQREVIKPINVKIQFYDANGKRYNSYNNYILQMKGRGTD